MKVEDLQSFRANLVENLNKIIKNKKLAVNVEKEYLIIQSKLVIKKYNRKWDNKYFVQIYIDRFKSIYLNINQNLIMELSLLNKIKKKKLKQEAVFMNHQELNPKMWKQLIEAKIKRDKNLTEVDMSAYRWFT